MARRFEIDGRITGQYWQFNAVGTQITVCLLPSRMMEIPSVIL